jgi:trans-aconitate methyltransferase
MSDAVNRPNTNAAVDDQIHHDAFEIRFPKDAAAYDQHEEWFEYTWQGERHRARIHDYDVMYAVPGLYEAMVYDTLKCCSPQVVVNELVKALQDEGIDPKTLRCLDLGAGNGVVGDYLVEAGASHLVGLDLLPEAKEATQRDRPGMYADYLVADLTDLSAEQQQRLQDAKLNTLVSVAALGYGDIPPLAFANALNQINEAGWIAINIRDRFLDPNDDAGFGIMLRQLMDEGVIEVRRKHTYVHRTNIAGDELEYVAFAGRKLKHIDNPERFG